MGNGQPNTICVSAGTNLITTPGGDDSPSDDTITTGADGICDTTATPNDNQAIPLGKGEPDAIAITS